MGTVLDGAVSHASARTVPSGDRVVIDCGTEDENRKSFELKCVGFGIGTKSTLFSMTKHYI